jgi:1-acyl-sn-glycerol-3-phosphate acyltransferase
VSGRESASLGLYRVVRGLIAGLAALLFRMRIEGKSNIPSSGAFVLAPVHRSNLDFALVAPITKRRMRYMGKDSLWKGPKLFGSFISALGAFPVHRGSADREALRRCIEIIERDEPLVLFPEGTRQSGPIVESIFEGAAYIASRTGVPIVPVGIGGSERAMPKGAKMIKPGKIVLVVGEPIEIDRPADGSRPSRRAVHELTERLHKEVQRLFDEAQVKAGA